MAQTSDWSAEGGGKFAKLSEEFIREMLALSPSTASHAGYRQHVDPKTGKIVALDGTLGAVRAAGIAVKRFMHSGASAPMSRLHLPRSAPKMRPIGDSSTTRSVLGLLEFDHIKNYKRSSTDYAAAVS